MSQAVHIIDSLMMPTYARQPVNFVRGEGCKLYDQQGREYTDFLAGIAVCNLGHANVQVAQAICTQAHRLVHVSNLYYSEPQARVAELLVLNSFADRVFFCNSGAEANEGAIKLSRLWGKAKREGAYKIIAMQGSFHGRTMKTLTATGQKKIQEGFDPLPEGFIHVPYGDLAAVASAVDDTVSAVLLEPVLGEGGVVVPPVGYLAGLRRLCDQNDLLLIFDEIQTGLGRTGKLFAYQHSGVAPDVMTLAKALANGLPCGAILAREEVGQLFGPGKHATTFGAGPVVMEAARVVLETLVEEGFMAGVAENGAYFKENLNRLAERRSVVKGVRGLGLMLGLELSLPGGPLVERLLERGLVVNCTQERVLRFLPPLVISQEEIDMLLAALDEVLADAGAGKG